MPYIVTRRYISDDQYLSHELAKLAECAFVLPWDITAAIASKLIGQRHDRQKWIDAFRNKITELHNNKTETK